MDNLNGKNKYPKTMGNLSEAQATNLLDSLTFLDTPSRQSNARDVTPATASTSAEASARHSPPTRMTSVSLDGHNIYEEEEGEDEYTGPTALEKGKGKAIILDDKDNDYNNDEFTINGLPPTPEEIFPPELPPMHQRTSGANFDAWRNVAKLWDDQREESNLGMSNNIGDQARDTREVHSATKTLYSDPRNNRVLEGRKSAGTTGAQGFLHPRSAGTSGRKTSNSRKLFPAQKESQSHRSNVKLRFTFNAEAPEFRFRSPTPNSNVQDLAGASEYVQGPLVYGASGPLNIASQMSVPPSSRDINQYASTGLPSGPPQNAPKGPKAFSGGRERPARFCQLGDYHNPKKDSSKGPDLHVRLIPGAYDSLRPRTWLQSGSRVEHTLAKPGQSRAYHEPDWHPEEQASSTSNVPVNGSLPPGNNVQRKIRARSAPLTNGNSVANNQQIASGAFTGAQATYYSERLDTEQSRVEISSVRLQSLFQEQPPRDSPYSSWGQRADQSSRSPGIRRNSSQLRSPFQTPPPRRSQSPTRSWTPTAAPNTGRSQSPFQGQISRPSRSSTVSWIGIPSSGTSSKQPFRPRSRAQQQQQLQQPLRSMISCNWRSDKQGNGNLDHGEVSSKEEISLEEEERSENERENGNEKDVLGNGMVKEY